MKTRFVIFFPHRFLVLGKMSLYNRTAITKAAKIFFYSKTVNHSHNFFIFPTRMNNKMYQICKFT